MQNIVLWTVGGLVALMLCLSGLVLGVPDTSAWTFSSVMDFVRTVATAGAAMLALLAYIYWRRPEETKRRADSAQEVARLSRRLEGQILATRMLSFVLLTEGKLSATIERVELLWAEPIPERDLRRLDKLLNEFQTFHDEAGELFKKTDAPKLMKVMEEQAEAIRSAWKTVAVFKRGYTEEMLQNGNMVRMIDGAIEVLGMVYTDRETTIGEIDVFKKKVQENGNALRKTLMRLLASK